MIASVLDHVEVAAEEVHLGRPISSMGFIEYWVTVR